jgi:uncharacterized protein YndB with AHSA1/START domain
LYTQREDATVTADALTLARRYHRSWTSGDYQGAIDLLAPTLRVEVPVNDYPTPQAFGQALRSFGGLVTGVEVLSEMEDGAEAMLLYDMQVEQLGPLRVAEHFTVAHGRIVRLRQIHDTAPMRATGGALADGVVQAAGSPPGPPADAYEVALSFAFPRERVFEALSTLDGLAGWWTRHVGGTPTTGGELRFAFAGRDETIVMRVDEATAPATIAWTCLVHTGHPEWVDTTIIFALVGHDDQSGELRFRHAGLTPDLQCYAACKSGWQRFLASLLSYAETGTGHPC